MAKILIIGSGGREHALAWKLKQSPQVAKIFVAPGNAGTAQLGENVSIPITDVGGLVHFAQTNKIDLTVVGQDDALAVGVVDAFLSKGLKIWGPTKAAAKIEWSKSFSKGFMKQADIPTANFKTFTDFNQALAYIKPQYLPTVIKADGLALGKGVTICRTMEEAEKTLRALMIDKIHGESGSEVVIEQFLQGREFGAHALSDGKNFLMFPPSQDHKAINDGDQGPNTGGMGVVAPLPWVNEDDMAEIKNHIIYRALEGLKDLGSPFCGLLYPGLMKTKDGIKVIEFNARFGDPECQVYMRLLENDLYQVLLACAEGRLKEIELKWRKGFACCVMLASGGYPDKYEKGLPISGIEAAEKMPDIVVFHSGTKLDNNQLLTNGGRVLGVTAIADDLKSALNKAYSAISKIHFDGMHYRKDIGKKTLNLIKN